MWRPKISHLVCQTAGTTLPLSQANLQIRSYDGKALNEKDQKYKAEKGNTILR